MILNIYGSDVGGYPGLFIRNNLTKEATESAEEEKREMIFFNSMNFILVIDSMPLIRYNYYW
ncbi:hypothetical protein CP500_018765 [Tychonema bourrellyi FEM_GT703]|uniref:Uncharacterized protein n=1 Tax=Tychonema bourrellyi FEM_GT703 TaxID=2040638 RepID=A0A2G4EWY2_9CYAN|nr:hypothetical protein CP500_018765 [Tychonema bourrellyi FEM_GT703]